VTHAGREYRLCSRACLDTFEANPDQYASVHGGAR
jgi:YHS domain-containing protein